MAKAQPKKAPDEGARDVAPDRAALDAFRVTLPPARPGEPPFEGPLDLLLHLVKEHQVDLFDIPIARITESYLATLEAMRELDIDIAGEFLHMAAQLMLMKSKLLLPRTEVGHEIVSDRLSITDAISRVAEVLRVRRRVLFEDLLAGPEGHRHGRSAIIATFQALLERKLIKILGKKEEPGRPILYGTTREFLEFFALKDLASLPTLREFHELSEEHRDIVEKEAPPAEGPRLEGLVAELADPALRAALDAKQ